LYRLLHTLISLASRKISTMKTTSNFGLPIDADSVMVHMLDFTSLNEQMNKDLYEKRIDGHKQFELNKSQNGFIELNGKYFVTDNELCGYELGERGFRFDIYEVFPPPSFALMPSMSGHLSLEQIKAACTGKTVTMKEFMGSRYRYNSRLESNEKSLLKWLSEPKAVAA